MSEGFSERHFELAINMELLQGSPKHHVLSQVEEMRGGYDIALIPALDAVWLMLGEYGGPEGASEAAGKRLPFAASLFLQYKVPAWLKGTKGAGESLERLKKFGERGTPYLRYELRERQFATLLRLSQEMIGKASVACAAPVFHTGDEFFERRMIRGIVDSTNFVSLGELAKGLLELGIHDHAHPGDHQWTYGLQPALGMLHSEGRAVESMLGREELLPWLRAKMIRAKEPLDVHFRSIAKAVRNWSTFLEVGSDKDGQELERGDEGRPSHPPESYAPWDPNEPRAPAIEALRTVERAGLGWHVALMPASALV